MASLARQGAQDQDLRRLLEPIAFSGDPLGALDSFVRSVFRYRDEDREIVRTIPFMLEWFETYGVLEGDCDCISTFIGASAAAMGYRSRFVAIRTDEFDSEFLHVFPEVWDGAWIRFDPTVPLSVVDQEIDYGRLIEYV